ncbi:MAG: hypothetical protein Q9190_005789 [Brigantiaea leucoxantha]
MNRSKDPNSSHDPRAFPFACIGRHCRQGTTSVFKSHTVGIKYGELSVDLLKLAPPSPRVRALSRLRTSFSLFRYLFPNTRQRTKARLSAFRYETLPAYRYRAQSRIYQFILKRQARQRKLKATRKSIWSGFARRRAVLNTTRSEDAKSATAIKMANPAGSMVQRMSEGDAAVGRGTRRKKLAGFIKSANELRQSYQQSYGLGAQRNGAVEEDDLGIPGAFPNVSIFRSGDEEMLLFPSYAKLHQTRRSSHRHAPGAADNIRNANEIGNADSWEREWDRYEEANSIVDVDVRGWIYSPQKGPMSRYNRLMVALARRLSGIPAPGNDRASSPNSGSHIRAAAHADRRQQDLVDQEAESIALKGEGEQKIAWQGGYSEAPSRKDDGSSTRSSPLQSRTPSPRTIEGSDSSSIPSHLKMTSAYQEDGNAPGPGHLAKRASWNQPSEMSPKELNSANSHMMLRLKPFMTTPLTDIPLTVFFYNDQSSKSRTIYSDERGHFNLRAALDFVPTNIRVLASDKLSATDEVHVTQPDGVSLISDVDDTIKHSAIGAGAREVFRNVFIRDLEDLKIDGVKEWYSKMAEMDVKLHYVSNMPWQLFPVLMTFLKGAGLPKGSFHLKHYSGMLQGIFEPVAERKKGTLDRIMHDFPRRRFILVGDSGEADLELYTDLVLANPALDRTVALTLLSEAHPWTVGDCHQKAPQAIWSRGQLSRRDNKRVPRAPGLLKNQRS